eukprot:12403062-Alexandrium_andersonii.AAC.1
MQLSRAGSGGALQHCCHTTGPRLEAEAAEEVMADVPLAWRVLLVGDRALQLRHWHLRQHRDDLAASGLGGGVSACVATPVVVAGVEELLETPA